MSANIDSMMYVGKVPWHGAGKAFETPLTSVDEIVTAAGIGWDVASQPMSTQLHGEIPDWHAVYRTDNNNVLGVVKRRKSN